MEKKNKIAVVALSGGVDSAVAALLLQKQGFEVVGITGKMMPCAEDICKNAKNVADTLKIRHIVLDLTEDFKRHVIDYFEKSYECGHTPNPCIKCNQFIKWGKIFEYAINELNADVFATGHYAKIVQTDGVYKLYPASDEHKDQLYFLYRLGQKQLAKTRFPLSDLTKAQVREIAHEYNLPPKSSKESQDICFIQKPMTTKKYLTEKFGTREGTFIDITTGKVVGRHAGCYLYTIGQRRGIGIAAPYPLYVIDIDTEKNIVYVGKEEDNYKNELEITDLNLVYPPEKQEFDAIVKIRYNMPHVKAHVFLEEKGARVKFYEPVNSVTRGQACVFYGIEDGHLIGGGWIE